MKILQRLYSNSNKKVFSSNLNISHHNFYSSKPNESIPKLNKSSPMRSLYFKSVFIWCVFGSLALQLQWVKMEVNQLEEKFKVESLLLKDQIEGNIETKLESDSDQETDLDEIRRASRAKFSNSSNNSNDKTGKGPGKVLI